MGSYHPGEVGILRRAVLNLFDKENVIAAYSEISLLSGPDIYKTIGRTDDAVQVKDTITWDHPFNTDIDPEFIKGHVRFQVMKKMIPDDDNLIGETFVPVVELLAGGGDSREEIGYDLKNKSGEVQGKLIISKIPPDCQQEIIDVVEEELPEKKKKNKLCGFAKRVGERVAATGIASAAAAVFSCFCRSAVDEEDAEEEEED